MDEDVWGGGKRRPPKLQFRLKPTIGKTAEGRRLARYIEAEARRADTGPESSSAAHGPRSPWRTSSSETYARPSASRDNDRPPKPGPKTAKGLALARQVALNAVIENEERGGGTAPARHTEIGHGPRPPITAEPPGGSAVPNNAAGNRGPKTAKGLALARQVALNATVDSEHLNVGRGQARGPEPRPQAMPGARHLPGLLPGRDAAPASGFTRANMNVPGPPPPTAHVPPPRPQPGFQHRVDAVYQAIGDVRRLGLHQIEALIDGEVGKRGGAPAEADRLKRLAVRRHHEQGSLPPDHDHPIHGGRLTDTDRELAAEYRRASAQQQWRTMEVPGERPPPPEAQVPGQRPEAVLKRAEEARQVAQQRAAIQDQMRPDPREAMRNPGVADIAKGAEAALGADKSNRNSVRPDPFGGVLNLIDRATAGRDGHWHRRLRADAAEVQAALRGGDPKAVDAAYRRFTEALEGLDQFAESQNDPVLNRLAQAGPAIVPEERPVYGRGIDAPSPLQLPPPHDPFWQQPSVDLQTLYDVVPNVTLQTTGAVQDWIDGLPDTQFTTPLKAQLMQVVANINKARVSGDQDLLYRFDARARQLVARIGHHIRDDQSLTTGAGSTETYISADALHNLSAYASEALAGPDDDLPQRLWNLGRRTIGMIDAGILPDTANSFAAEWISEPLRDLATDADRDTARAAVHEYISRLNLFNDGIIADPADPVAEPPHGQWQKEAEYNYLANSLDLDGDLFRSLAKNPEGRKFLVEMLGVYNDSNSAHRLGIKAALLHREGIMDSEQFRAIDRTLRRSRVDPFAFPAALDDDELETATQYLEDYANGEIDSTVLLGMVTWLLPPLAGLPIGVLGSYTLNQAWSDARRFRLEQRRRNQPQAVWRIQSRSRDDVSHTRFD